MYNEKKGKAIFYKSIRLSGVAVLLDYTKMAIKQTITDLKRTDYIRNVATQVIYIIYLIYTLIAGAGYLAANIVLLVLSVSYTVFFLTMTSCGKTPEGKNVKRGHENLCMGETSHQIIHFGPYDLRHLHRGRKSHASFRHTRGADDRRLDIADRF